MYNISEALIFPSYEHAALFSPMQIGFQSILNLKYTHTHTHILIFEALFVSTDTHTHTCNICQAPQEGSKPTRHAQ